jgi:DNA modification methylase
MNYATYTNDKLVSLCKERGLKGYSGKKKAFLISLLSSDENSSSPHQNGPSDENSSSPHQNVPSDESTSSPLEDVKSDENHSLEHIFHKNTFYVGDNLELLLRVPSETIDMIYMDPPYNTGRNFYYFQDKFADFPSFMEKRIAECHRILKTNGNIIIHVEPRISHQIRNLCDKIFGENHFNNEIVWHTGGNAKNKYQLGRNHDTLIVYGKSSQSKFFPLYHPYTDEHKKGLKKCPHHNKLYNTSAAHNSQPEVNPRPNLNYEWNGHVKQWYVSIDKMRTLHDDHRLEYNKDGIPRIKRFIEEMQGIPVRDTWDDISSIQYGEKTKYATQKPIKLLQRVLALYSAEGDFCMDPFAGSGTLGRACRTMKRNYLLFDINPEAKELFDTAL